MRYFKMIVTVIIIMQMILMSVGCVQTTPGNTSESSSENMSDPNGKPGDHDVTLLFQIDEGNGGYGVTSLYGDDMIKMKDSIENIINGIKPLKEKYKLAVLIYPTHNYKAAGYTGNGATDPLDRISPNLHEAFEIFAEAGVEVYLEMHSSGIRTNQNGELAFLPAAELRYGDGEPAISLPIDMDTMIALKEKYKSTFAGIRFHELIGSNDIGLQDREAGRERFSHGWVVQEDVLKGIIDAASESGLKLIWSDHSWNTVYTSDKRLVKNKAYWIDWLDYAIDKLGTDNVTLNIANNGWPVHQYVTDAFGLKHYRDTDYGESVQSWFWQGMDCGTSTWYPGGGASEKVKWYLYPELDMPAELMAAFTLRALKNGAKVIQYEPTYYLFNSYIERFRPPLDMPLQYEYAPDFTPRLVLKRLINYLMYPEASENPSTSLEDYFDTDRAHFSQNSERNSAKRYYQNTIGVISDDDSRRYFDRYNNDYTKWIENSNFRSIDNMFGENVIMASRINLTFSCTDEIFIVKRTQEGVVGEFYNNLMGHIMTDKTTFSDNEDGDFIFAVPVNLFYDYIASLDGTGDDMIVVRRKNDSDDLHFSVYKCSSHGTVEHQQFRYIRLSADEEADILTRYLGTSDLSASLLLGVVPVRYRNSIYLDGTRPVDAGVIALQRIDIGLRASGMINGNQVDQTIQLDGKSVIEACTSDIDGDFFDEICLLVGSDNIGDSGSSIQFLKYDKAKNRFALVPDAIELGADSFRHIYSFRVGTYTKAGTFPE